MLADRGEGNLGAWQQVSPAFASSIVLKAHRLASYIQGQLAHYLNFARRPFLPVWLPDYRVFTSAHWAERLVSKVYDTIHSLPSIAHEAPPLSVEPSPLVWFRPNQAWPAMPEESEHMETEQERGFEATAFSPDSVELRQHTAPRTGGESHTVFGRHIGATPQPHRTSKKASLFVQRQRSPIAHLRRMGLRLGLPAEPDDATSQGPSRHLTYTGLVEEEKSIPSAVEEATGRGDRILAGSRGESNVVQHYDGLGQPIFPQFLARALSLSRSFEALPRVQKVIAFVHRLLTAPAEAPQAQGLMPLTISTAATDAHPRVAMEGAASTVIGRVGPGRTEESIEPLLVGTVSGRDVAPGRPSTISGGRQFTAWLHGRRYALGRVSFSEQMDEATEEDVQAGLPGSLHAGSQFSDAKMMSPSPEFVFPSLPIVQPASPEEDLTLQALQPVASHDLVLPHHRQPPLEERAPVLGPLSRTEPSTTIMGVEPSAPTPLGGPSHAGAGLGLALAPLERPRGPAEPSGAAESVTAGAAGGQEATEEAAEANLEHLARDVYAVLRRRLAWEKERNMVLIS